MLLQCLFCLSRKPKIQSDTLTLQSVDGCLFQLEETGSVSALFAMRTCSSSTLAARGRASEARTIIVDRTIIIQSQECGRRGRWWWRRVGGPVTMWTAQIGTATTWNLAGISLSAGFLSCAPERNIPALDITVPVTPPFGPQPPWATCSTSKSRSVST